MTRLHDVRGSLQVEVPEMGVLDFRVGEAAIEFLSDYGDDRHYANHPLACGIPRISSLLVEGGLLLADLGGDGVYLFRFSDLELVRIAELGRSDSEYSEFLFFRFIRDDDVVLGLYENGVLCLERNGALRWHVVHGQYGYSFDGTAGGRVRFHDASGRTHSYSIADGSEAAE